MRTVIMSTIDMRTVVIMAPRLTYPVPACRPGTSEGLGDKNQGKAVEEDVVRPSETNKDVVRPSEINIDLMTERRSSSEVVRLVSPEVALPIQSTAVVKFANTTEPAPLVRILILILIFIHI